MKQLLNRLLVLVALVVVFGVGFLLAKYWFEPKEKLVSQEDATVLLEKIKTVSKLVTVEGYFSELYNYKDYWTYDWSIFRKKALLRVKARVSAGYDLSNMKIDMLPDQKRIIITRIPKEPQIIAIDHSIDYYDISEGSFNSFSESDYNKLNRNARDFIEKKAKESDLLPRARTQGLQILDLIRFMGENAGWTVQMDGVASNTKTIGVDTLRN
jgi:Protein of unknown function (DUF4230)